MKTKAWVVLFLLGLTVGCQTLQGTYNRQPAQTVKDTFEYRKH